MLKSAWYYYQENHITIQIEEIIEGMSLIRFVHAADLHLDSPFSGLSSVAPEISHVLHQATFDAYKRIIDLCIDEKVDALLVAGDVFDGADRSLKAQLKFIEGLNRLEEAGIRSFICHGNHDPLDGWEANLSLPKGCYRFGPKVERVSVFPDEPQRALIYGVSYPQREVRENLIPGFGQAEPGVLCIGLLHANVGGNTEHESYAPCTLADLESTGINYWALGHVHTRDTLKEMNPTVVYPGNPQGRHPNERGERGVYLVEVSDSGQVRKEFRPVDVVRWETVSLDIADLESEQALIETMDERLSVCKLDADDRSLVIRLELCGRGQLHRTLARQDFVSDLLDQVNESWSHQRPFVWCERILISTALPIDRETRRQGTDFLGDLLKLCDEIRDDQDALAEMQKLLGDIYNRGNASQYLRGHLPESDEIRSMIAVAEDLCLMELLDEEDD